MQKNVLVVPSLRFSSFGVLLTKYNEVSPDGNSKVADLLGISSCGCDHKIMHPQHVVSCSGTGGSTSGGGSS